MQKGTIIRVKDFIEDNHPQRGNIVNRKSLPFIIGVIFLLVAFGIGVYYLGAKANREYNTALQLVKISSSVSGENIFYAENGFSFYYPHSIEMFQAWTDAIFWRFAYTPGNYINDALILRYSDKPFSRLVKGGTFNIYTKTYPAEQKVLTIESFDETSLDLGAREISMYTIGCGVDCSYHVVRFKSNNKFYELLANGVGEGSLERFKNILASFSFYDANSKKWREYLSRKGHFSIQYPSSATFLEKVYTSVDGVRGYSNNLINIFFQNAGLREGRLTISFERIETITLDEYLRQNDWCSSDLIYETEYFKLNNEQAVYQNTGCGPSGSSYIVVKHNDFFYTIGETWPEDPMLAKFKFVD